MSMYGAPQSAFVDDGSHAMSSSSSSSSPAPPQPSCPPNFPCRCDNQNPPSENQTLEDAFARLSVSSNHYKHPPFDFFGDGFSLDGGAAKIFPLDDNDHELYRTHQRSNNFGQMPDANIEWQKPGLERGSDVANNAGEIPLQNYWMGCDRDSKSFWPASGSYPESKARGYSFNRDGILYGSEPFSWEEGYGRDFPTVPLSNRNAQNYGDEFCFDLHRQKSRGAILNELVGNRSSSNVPGFHYVNGRRPHWMQQQQQQHHQHQHPLNHLSLSVYDLQGKVLLLAKDQYGCRILQEAIRSFTNQEISLVLFELIDNLIELMVDPFGNYVIQKLVEVCGEEQRTHIIIVVTRPDFPLVSICLNVHGTRAVQKLLEHVTTQEQRSLIMSALSPAAVALTRDTNGHHVILHCLKHFSPEDNMYLLNVVANNSFGIASDKSGCCVLQQCIDHAQGETKKHLIAEIIANASLLSEDCYGNYVVQHLLTLKIPRVAESLQRQLEGKFLSLSRNKYGSNVVEKFLQDSGEQLSKRIILELLHNPNVSMLLVDPYGNYVIRSALLASKGAIRNALLELIQLNSGMMRSNLYGKKLLARFDRAKLRHM